MAERTGYSTTTYRLRLYEKHRNWMEMTCDIYNQVQKFYYDIILERMELWELSNQPLMRQLELMSVGARGQEQQVEYPFPYGKVPLYFRRAAINAAIGASRGYMAAYRVYSAAQEENQDAEKTGQPSAVEEFHTSPVFYAGMYRNLTEKDIELKLWNGSKWVWNRYRYDNLKRPFPEQAELKSPTLKLKKDAAWLHFPVTVPVEDIRTVKERMEQHGDVCAVYFPNNDTMAVCSWMKKDGAILEHYYIKGGNERKEKRRQLVGRLKKSRESRNHQSKKNEKENSRIYQQIANLNQYYSHKVSREVVEYCIRNQIQVIVVPNYETTLDFTDKRYLKTDEFEWIGRSIITNLKYKSYQKGIITATVRPYHITDSCHICGAPLKRYNEGHMPSKKYYGGQLYICENGHKGNAASNSADNIGKYFLKYY